MSQADKNSKLVIVESPAKAKTIAGYLGPSFHVLASVGHVRDLPKPSDLPADMKKGPYGKFAVDVDDGFDPYYVVSPDKKKTVTQLRKALKEADELYLATDEDREGEAIAWHLLQVLKPKVPVYRMVFHEITKDAISNALANTRELDTDLVDAQETRRVLDRLHGYEVSPLLWRKVQAGSSAGRVQSVATRMVVDRERERIEFVPATYWDIAATLANDEGEFEAKLVELDGHRLATGRDFGDDGQLTKKAQLAKVHVLQAEQASALGKALEKTSPYTVQKLDTKPYTRRPAAPFTTSTLQQEASRKLRMSSRQTMRVAQTLYENGFITYMRTDSTALSSQAIAAARKQASELYGATSIPAKPRFYATKSKGAQEAHEAIRPAGAHFRSPDQVAGQISGAELRLYDLIWKRTVASQMNDARGQTATVRIQADSSEGKATFSASGTVITDRGFLAAYEEGRAKDRYAKSAGENVRLPKLSEGDTLQVKKVDYEDREHTTTPPPRYTEASLVKALEERGIGRPSTYAATIGVIGDRGYVLHRGQALIPTWLAFSVTRLLEQNLPDLVDYDFTASLEEDLDKIAAGNADRKQWLGQFYFGADGSGEVAGLKHAVSSLGDIDARTVNTIDLGEGVAVRVGRFGPYLEDKDGKRASIPDDVAPDELSPEKVKELYAAAADDGRELGVYPNTGRTIVAKNGRFGPYVTEVIPEEEQGTGKKTIKPKTASLLKTQNLADITFEDALQLLSLPREVGTDPESGEVITAQNGRFGPYLKKGKDSRSLETEEQMFTITLEEALKIYSQPKQRGRRAAKPPLRELGTDPATEKPVVIKDGRFGPYITDGTTNVTVPRGESIEHLEVERAFQLLADKRAKGPRKKATKKTTKRSTAKKTTTKKTTTKKAATKKTTAKKPAAKKTAAKKSSK